MRSQKVVVFPHNALDLFEERFRPCRHLSRMFTGSPSKRFFPHTSSSIFNPTVYPMACIFNGMYCSTHHQPVHAAVYPDEGGADDLAPVPRLSLCGTPLTNEH